LELPEKPKVSRLITALIATAIICLLVGGMFGYAINSLAISNQMSDLQNRLSDLENNVSDLQPGQGTPYENDTYFLEENVSLAQLYDQVRSSVVLVRGTTTTTYYYPWGQPYYEYAEVQGSGFVSNSTGQFVIVTNYHVVDGASNITVTFADGDAYSSEVVGSDPYADLAVLTSNAPQDEYNPLSIANSSALSVGDPVLAIGTPYGLAGTVTSGIVSALGRTITESTTNGYVIADCIQTTTPINPGNSGGPLLNYEGEVVGITTAIVSDSQGIGFAIPSNTILRETESLITNGSYNQHPWLGASGTDMTFGIAQAMNTSTTYGWLITQVTSGGPADKAGLQEGTKQAQIAGQLVKIGGDIVTAIDDAKITNIDDLSTYLEEHTSPGQTISVEIVRNNETLILSLKLEARP
jgi:S1-C subfamily serine protease